MEHTSSFAFYEPGKVSFDGVSECCYMEWSQREFVPVSCRANGNVCEVPKSICYDFVSIAVRMGEYDMSTAVFDQVMNVVKRSVMDMKVRQ